ncbi:uncharacterized protein [Procambarus clarkii]|uniref:uncharacterized protein n=1 Tax=Procambarus clarkii TaxID=6728 RepID=UPI00374222B3
MTALHMRLLIVGTMTPSKGCPRRTRRGRPQSRGSTVMQNSNLHSTGQQPTTTPGGLETKKEQAQEAGDHTPAHRGHPPQTIRQAQVKTNQGARRPPHVTRELTQRQRAGKRIHSPQPWQPRAADNLQQGRQAPHQQPRTTRKPPAADAPPPPPNGEPPRQEPPGPQSTPVEQTYHGQTKQGQKEHLPNPPQEPSEAPGQGEKAMMKPHAHLNRESPPPRKLREPQLEEHHSQPPHSPQHHTGNKCESGPDKKP